MDYAAGRRVATKHEKRAKGKSASSASSDFSSWLRSVAIAAVIVVVLRMFVVGIARVEGPSMRLTFLTGDRIVYSKLSYVIGEPQRFDVVICHYPRFPDQYVKRIIALPGETVEGRDAVIYVNGEPLAEEYLTEVGGEDFAAVTVPEGHYFVVGDNRNRSSDSRLKEVGPIAFDMIEGKAVMRIWPLESLKMIGGQ